MAQVHRILGRNRPTRLGVTRSADFRTVHLHDLPVAEALGDLRHASPYALEPDARRVCFVVTPPGVDPAAAHPLFYEAQRQDALTRIDASFEEVIDLASSMGPSAVSVVSLYSAGRSGSTATCAVAATLPGVHALSEPDIFSPVVVSEETANLVPVLRATVRLLVAHRVAVDPQIQVLVVKHRGLALFGADTIRVATDSRRALALSRDLVEVVDSYMGAYLDGLVWRVLRRSGADRLVVAAGQFLLPRSHPWLVRAVPALVSPQLGGSRFASSSEWATVLVWTMQQAASSLLQSGRATPLAFDALQSRPEAFLVTLATALGVPTGDTSTADLLTVLGQDAHRGTDLSAVRGCGLLAAERERVTRLAARLTSHDNAHQEVSP